MGDAFITRRGGGGSGELSLTNSKEEGRYAFSNAITANSFVADAMFKPKVSYNTNLEFTISIDDPAPDIDTMDTILPLDDSGENFLCITVNRDAYSKEYNTLYASHLTLNASGIFRVVYEVELSSTGPLTTTASFKAQLLEDNKTVLVAYMTKSSVGICYQEYRCIRLESAGNLTITSPVKIQTSDVPFGKYYRDVCIFSESVSERYMLITVVQESNATSLTTIYSEPYIRLLTCDKANFRLTLSQNVAVGEADSGYSSNPNDMDLRACYTPKSVAEGGDGIYSYVDIVYRGSDKRICYFSCSLNSDSVVTLKTVKADLRPSPSQHFSTYGLGITRCNGRQVVIPFCNTYTHHICYAWFEKGVFDKLTFTDKGMYELSAALNGSEEQALKSYATPNGIVVVFNYSSNLRYAYILENPNGVIATNNTINVAESDPFKRIYAVGKNTAANVTNFYTFATLGDNILIGAVGDANALNDANTVHKYIAYILVINSKSTFSYSIIPIAGVKSNPHISTTYANRLDVSFLNYIIGSTKTKCSLGFNVLKDIDTLDKLHSVYSYDPSLEDFPDQYPVLSGISKTEITPNKKGVIIAPKEYKI